MVACLLARLVETLAPVLPRLTPPTVGSPRAVLAAGTHQVLGGLQAQELASDPVWVPGVA